MIRRAFLGYLVAIGLLAGTGWASVDRADMATLDRIVGKAMAGYNSGNSQEFYANWAALVKPMENSMAFQRQYLDTYKRAYGSYRSRRLIENQSEISTTNAIAVYHAQFSKKPGTLTVSFVKEGSVYRIQDIRFSP